jgi:RimJ/RimL family protein N-acetyltransferase
MDRIETERLILRPFVPDDAEDVFSYAHDLRVGPAAGWTPHRDLEESREMIRTTLSLCGIAAMEFKANGRVIGCVGYMDRYPAGKRASCPDNEIGYDLHPDYWGFGLMSEAVEAMIRWGFVSCGYHRIWCGHFAGNWRSARVIQKCGFRYQFSLTEDVKQLNMRRQTFLYVLTRGEWNGRVSGAV